MAWNNNKTGHVPPSTKRRIMNRDQGICYVCHQPGADQIDHIIPLSQNGAHHDSNLAPIHAAPCHADKTKAEAARGRARRSGKRPPKPHPGLKGGG